MTDHFAYQIKQALNEGANQIDGDKLAKLRAARQAALKSQKSETPLSSLALATGGGGNSSGNLGWARWAGNLLPLGVLVAGLIAISAYHQNQRVANYTEIDAAVLADELELNAYLDKGFGHFVKKQAE